MFLKQFPSHLRLLWSNVVYCISNVPSNKTGTLIVLNAQRTNPGPLWRAGKAPSTPGWRTAPDPRRERAGSVRGKSNRRAPPPHATCTNKLCHYFVRWLFSDAVRWNVIKGAASLWLVSNRKSTASCAYDSKLAVNSVSPPNNTICCFQIGPMEEAHPQTTDPTRLTSGSWCCRPQCIPHYEYKTEDWVCGIPFTITFCY